MATIFVRSGATGGADGTTWADAYILLQDALDNWALGDIIWMAHDHYETKSDGDLIFTCATALDGKKVSIYRVNSSTNIYSPTGKSGSGIVNIETTNSYKDISFSFHSNWFGIKFLSSDSIKAGANASVYQEDCYLTFAEEVTGHIDLSSSPLNINKNCHYKSGAGTTEGFMDVNGIHDSVYIGCSFDIASRVAGFIVPSSGVSSTRVSFIDCDLTQLTNDTLVDTDDLVSFQDEHNLILFQNCQLKATYILGSINIVAPSSFIKVIGCSANGSSTYLNELEAYTGRASTSITTYLDTGYQEYDGDVNLSTIMTPHDRCQPYAPLISFNISGIVEDLGSKVFTVQLVENFTTPLTKQDCWVELYYYNNANNTHHKIDTSSREFAKLTYTALAAGDGLSAWTGAPAGSRSVQIAITVTIAKKGFYYGILHVGKYESGKVVHVDPVLVVT